MLAYITTPTKKLTYLFMINQLFLK